MKKSGILNKDISEIIASLGHYQQLIICDAGFPIPPGVRRVDLALLPGLPSFLDVLTTVLDEICLEQVYIAEETVVESPERYAEIQRLTSGIKQELIAHSTFKDMSKSAIACIRSGECTPYSNIMLVSGVTY